MKWHCGREPTSRPTVHNTNMMYVLRTMSAMVRPVRTADLAIGSDFFFSSRRRHTRFSRDWSSDVCLPISRLLERDLPLPLALAPTGYTRMMHPGGEIAGARAAQRYGLPYALSTMATTTIEDLAAAVSSRSTSPDRPPGQPDLWFQLYIQRDSGMNKDLVDRAAGAGYRVLMVTVDTTVTGNRTRDRRNGLLIPPELTIQTLASIAAKPGYWVRMLRSDPIEFANFAGQRGFTIHRTGDLFNPAASWD